MEVTMPINLKLLTSATNHHALELQRLLAVKCEHTGDNGPATRVLLAALFD
jgi:hypothetical protein